MAVAELVYRITPPKRQTVDEVAARLETASRSMIENQWIVSIGIDIEFDHLVFMIVVKGHDRWTIKRRAPHLVVSILVRADLHARDSELVEVRPLPSLRDARYWSSGTRNKGKRVFVSPDGAERVPRKVQRRTKPTHPAMVQKRSGWGHHYQGQGH